MCLFLEFGVKVINNQAFKKMRLNIILLPFICLLPALVFGQTSGKGKIGVTYSVGGASSFNSGLVGAPCYEFTNATSCGLIYLSPKTKSIEWETGVNYSLFNIKTTPAPGIDGEISNSTMTLIDIPLGVRATFADYLFANGGMLIGLEMTNYSTFDNQSGFGIYGGVGGNYDFKFGGSVFINPYVKLHSLIPFSAWKNHSRVLDYGVKVGIMYSF